MSATAEPPAEDPRTAVRRSWLPACLTAVEGLDDDAIEALSYLVVEEMVEDITTVTIAPWPAADGYGRLRFAEVVAEVAVPTELLQTQLYRGWLDRQPHVGDVFAARIATEVLDEATSGVWNGPLGRLLPDGVYDLRAEGRKLARLAVHAVRSDILEPTEARANRLDGKVARNARPARFRPLLGGTAEGSPR